MTDRQYVLEARGVRKIFGNHLALDNVDFGLRPGEVHALLGENGAGKSTLIKILTGAYQPDGGGVFVDGAQVHLDNPLHAQTFGIGTVYQEVNLLPNRSVAENLFLGHQPRRFGLVDFRRMERDAREVLARYDLHLDPSSELGTHSVAVQQIVAIARAVQLSGKVLILDEPTASLDRNEVERLFDVVRGLKARGLAIIFITHFLDQVFAISDRVTVLRNGKLIETRTLESLSRTDVVRLMLGKDIAFSGATDVEPSETPDEVLLEFKGFGRKRGVHPFDLTIHKGEVVGMAGLLGSGRTEVARIMFGADPADQGTVSVNGKPTAIRKTTDAIKHGFGFTPEDRKAEGILGDLSVRENIVIALQGKLGWFRALNRDEQLEIAGRFGEAMDIRAASLDMPVKLLSGGNQQKVILSRWLATDPAFLILDEPTRGIDVGAHAEIVRTINRLRDEGMAMLVISSELDEVVAYSSRIVVMRDREMVAELRGRNINPGVIVQAIANNPDEAVALKRLHLERLANPQLLALVAVLLINWALFPNFFRITWQDGRLFGSLIDVLNRGAPVAILAIGMTGVIATKGVDLSVGAIMAVCGAVAATMVVAGYPTPVAVIAALAVGLLCGLWNGFLVAVLDIQPIIATLVLMVAGRGIAQLITEGYIVTFNDPALIFIGTGSFLGFPMAAVIALVLMVLVTLLVKRTAIGLFIQAIGVNRAAASLAGIHSRMLLMLVYSLSGFCAAVAGIIVAADIRGADANNSGLWLELDAILAVVLGGTSLLGGRFSIPLAVVGALIIQAMNTGILVSGFRPEFNLIVKAGMIILILMLQSSLVGNAFGFFRRDRKLAAPK